jgi:hypothetical protein
MKIKLDEMTLTYRHDIFFRQYVLESMDQVAYEQYYANIEAVNPPKRKRTFDQFMNLLNSMKKEGQQESIMLEKVENPLYETPEDNPYFLVPRDGAHRIAIMLHLGVEDIDIDIIEEVEWKDRSLGYTITGERSYAFNNVHPDAIEYIGEKAEEHASMHHRKFSKSPEEGIG